MECKGYASIWLGNFSSFDVLDKYVQSEYRTMGRV